MGDQSGKTAILSILLIVISVIARLSMTVLYFAYLLVSPGLVLYVLSECNTSQIISLPIAAIFEDAAISGIYSTFSTLPDFIKIPVYVFAGLALAITAFIAIPLIVNAPVQISNFHMIKTSEFLFEDKKKTIKYFLTAAFPLAFLAVQYASGPLSFAVAVMESASICCVSTTVVFLICTGENSIGHIRDNSNRMAERIFSVYAVFVVLLLITGFTAASILAFFCLERDTLWRVVFIAFLIISTYSSLAFIRENFHIIMKNWIKKEPG